MKLFELSDYKALIAAVKAADLDLVLVGGQAVNYYSAYYLPVCEELRALTPFVSKDADLLGTVDDGLRLAQAMNAQWKQNPRKGGMQGLSLGNLVLSDQPEAKVEILGRILGSDAASVRASAYTVEAPGGQIKVINPFLLYIVKGINLVRLSQAEAGRERQDGRQFIAMGIVVATILRQFVHEQSGEAHRALVKACGRLVEFWLTPDGAALVRAGAAQPTVTLPLAALREHPSASVRNVAEKRLPVFFEHQLPTAMSNVAERTVEKIKADLKRIAVAVGLPDFQELPVSSERPATTAGK